MMRTKFPRHGSPEAITAVFAEAMVQTCIVHLLRNSTDFLSWKDRKPLVTALKGIYRAVDAKAAEGTTLRTYGPLSQGYRLSRNTRAEASIRLESEGSLPNGGLQTTQTENN